MAGRLFYNHSYTSSVNFDTHKMKSFVAVLALVAVAAADVSHIVRSPEADAQIVAQEVDVFPDQYKYAYATSNGIQAQESGAIQNVGKENEAIEAAGSYSYTAPDGTKIETSYRSGPDGYYAQGAHLPIPPPIPEYIARAIEYIRTHPPKPESNQRL